ncbi:MAG TPA: 2'-5' RNA ligase family protein [Aliidongia sp.]|nr:2'-5' RNA ligase family protein [Aliidongia sp.]
MYFAFKPEPDVADHVISIGNRLRTKHGLAGEVSPAVLHVTICPIGYFPELSEERIDAARKVAGRLMARSFEVTLDHVRTYPNGREKLPLVAFADNGVPGAALFRHALVADLRRGGFMFPSRLPEPHMTLFYDRRVVAEESIDPIHWMVRDFVLVHSIQREGRHEILGRWPLRS